MMGRNGTVVTELVVFVGVKEASLQERKGKGKEASAVSML